MLVDFLLSRPFQEDIPLHMFVFPANEEARLPEVFVEHSQIPANPATMPPEEIARNREAWIQAWTEVGPTLERMPAAAMICFAPPPALCP